MALIRIFIYFFIFLYYSSACLYGQNNLSTLSSLANNITYADLNYFYNKAIDILIREKNLWNNVTLSRYVTYSSVNDSLLIDPSLILFDEDVFSVLYGDNSFDIKNRIDLVKDISKDINFITQNPFILIFKPFDTKYTLHLGSKIRFSECYIKGDYLVFEAIVNYQVFQGIYADSDELRFVFEVQKCRKGLWIFQTVYMIPTQYMMEDIETTFVDPKAKLDYSKLNGAVNGLSFIYKKLDSVPCKR